MKKQGDIYKDSNHDIGVDKAIGSGGGSGSNDAIGRVEREPNCTMHSGRPVVLTTM
jgi:hypothetical protein